MPLTGTRDLSSILPSAPLVPGFDTGTWSLPGAQVLQVIYEIRQGAMVSLLPPALHPTIPPTLLFNITHVPESSAGPFTLAEVRVGCRSAARPRAFVARACCDNETAAAELRRRWGYPIAIAEIELKRRYDRITAKVTSEGNTILDAALINPDPISGGDVQYLPNVNLARTVRDGREVARLVQVDPEYVIHRADRGKPQLTTLDAAAWLVGGAEPSWPVSASFVTTDIVMPQIRYIMDPARNPLQAVETVRHS